MAQQVIMTLVDDFDGSAADETVTFALDGRSYEIDLTAEHAKALRENLADYIDHGRRISQRAAKEPATAQRGGRTAVDREQTQAIREWARQNGHEVSDRGRVPKRVVDAFNAAH